LSEDSVSKRILPLTLVPSPFKLALSAHDHGDVLLTLNQKIKIMIPVNSSHHISRFLFLFLFTCITSQQVGAQKLARRVYLGIRMENLTADALNIMGLTDVNGVLVSEVLPNSTAAAAGFKKGDVLVAVNNVPTTSTSATIAYLGTRKAGDAFTYELVRNKKKLKGKAIFTSWPEEHYPGIDMVYTETVAPTGLQRIIISKPKNETHLPVIVFIGGMGCYSLDFPQDSTQSEVQLLNRLTRAGYLCARAEKPGMGDNVRTCKPCNQISLQEETASYVSTIKELKQREDVDSNSVYIFGHSMGGVFAPLVAQQTPVKGVIAYGAIGSNFLEYLVKSRKTIAEAYEMNPEESDDLVKNFCECAVYYFADSLSGEEASKKNPACGELLSVFDLRSRAYNEELYALNIPSLWKNYTGKALVLWGESDYVSSRDDHEMIALAINYYHPGNATFLTVKNIEHGMHTAATFQEAKNNPGAYNTELGTIIVNWLQQQQS
jgi:pimeloyl-ACP methyl ester carboxylesterase